jgi:uncharacterized protein YdaU (DUF1376 family)
MGKQPYIPLYVGDYLKDTRMLPLSVRGAWVDILLFMWDAPVRGEITGTLQEISRMIGCDSSEAKFALDLLKQKNTATINLLPSGEYQIISRRMKRDAEISAIRSEVGKKGVEAKKKKDFASPNAQAKSKQNTDNENVIVNEDEILKEYVKWSEQILDNNDSQFETMLFNERWKIVPEIFVILINDHVGLLHRYPKMRPPTQHAFRMSLIKHIRENKDKYNGKPIGGNNNSKGASTAATADYLTDYYRNKAAKREV